MFSTLKSKPSFVLAMHGAPPRRKGYDLTSVVSALKSNSTMAAPSANVDADPTATDVGGRTFRIDLRQVYPHSRGSDGDVDRDHAGYGCGA